MYRYILRSGTDISLLASTHDSFKIHAYGCRWLCYFCTPGIVVKGQKNPNHFSGASEIQSVSSAHFLKGLITNENICFTNENVCNT